MDLYIKKASFVLRLTIVMLLPADLGCTLWLDVSAKTRRSELRGVSHITINMFIVQEKYFMNPTYFCDCHKSKYYYNNVNKDEVFRHDETAGNKKYND
ncbi:MAG: hypothetical protein LBQ58_08325 [Synergistaceae bacterium]|jgi:hypothetical protein|nr:hypothetical protein [Synergistaceae bacterium]